MPALERRVMVHTLAAIATTSTLALAANAKRAYALLVNDSDTDIYLHLDGAAAVLNRGVLVTAAGGFYEMTVGQGNLTTDAIYGIQGGSSTKRLLVTEGS